MGGCFPSSERGRAALVALAVATLVLGAVMLFMTEELTMGLDVMSMDVVFSKSRSSLDSEELARVVGGDEDLWLSGAREEGELEPTENGTGPLELTAAELAAEVFAEEAAADTEQDRKDSASLLPDEAPLLQRRTGPVRLLLFNGGGASSRSWGNNLAVLSKCSHKGIEVTTTKKITSSQLTRENFDVVLLPGGSSGHIINANGGRSVLKPLLLRFLRAGGGYMGICAGAYTARSFGMAPWKKSGGMLGFGAFDKVEASPWFYDHAVEHLSKGPLSLNKRPVLYANGPIFKNLTASQRAEMDRRGKFSNAEVLVTLPREKSKLFIMSPSRRKKVFRSFNSNAIMVKNQYFNGQVVLSTGHPESDLSRGGVHSLKTTPCGTQLASMLMNMVYVAANRTTGFTTDAEAEGDDASSNP